MRRLPIKCVIGAATATTLLSLSPDAWGQQALDFALEVPGVRNFAGFGIGAVPDYLGSDDYTIGIAPIAKIQFGETERYIRLLATELSLNVINSRQWSFGPVLNYRPERDDVDDAAVDRMESIDSALEAGLFGGWTWISALDPRQRFNASIQFLNDISDTHDGYTITAAARYWHPVSRAWTLSLGISSTYASEDYTSTYFGVNAADSARSGLRLFSADSGMRDLRIAPTVIFSLSPYWHLGAGVIYSRLLDDAADSPIVDDRGSADQFFAGIGIVYAW